MLERIERTDVSASTIRVRLAFSIVNFVLPSCPAIRPIGYDLEVICAGDMIYLWLETDDLRVTF